MTRFEKLMSSVDAKRIIARALRCSGACVQAFEAAEGFPCYDRYGESCLACPLHSRASIDDAEQWLLGEVDA